MRAERPTPGGHHVEHGAANGARDERLLLLQREAFDELPHELAEQQLDLHQQRVVPVGNC